MKKTHLLPLLLAALLASCGSSKSELRAELQSIDREIMAIRIAVNQHRSQMSQSEVDAFFGSFAVGYGARSGDYGLAVEGAVTTNDAFRKYDSSAYSLEQLKERYIALGKRRMQVAHKLQ
jgi:Ni,Fe-hydrogenase I small subunit